LLAVVACHGRDSTAIDASPAGASSGATPTSSASSGASSSASVTASAMPVPPPPSSGTYPLLRKATLGIDELSKLVTASPELNRVGTDLAFFDPEDGSYIARSNADREGISFTTSPLLWSPEPGQQVLVVAARGKSASFVAAWWVLPDGSYRLASTFVMLGEIAPVALAHKATERTLWWTSCWQCPGETGHVSVRDDHHVVIVED
jgi:hypothetical protein